MQLKHYERCGQVEFTSLSLLTRNKFCSPILLVPQFNITADARINAKLLVMLEGSLTRVHINKCQSVNVVAAILSLLS